MIEILEMKEILACEVKVGDHLVFHGEAESYVVTALIPHAATGLISFAAYPFLLGADVPMTFTFLAAHLMNRVVR